MSKQQIQADIANNREEEMEEALSAEQIKEKEAQWDETLNSPESANFLNNLLGKALAEMKEKK